jgi:tetratricopeptide (TPR) repeat protein
VSRGAVALADASPAELRNRVRFFDRAIALHPTLGDAHAGLANAWMLLGAYRAGDPLSAYAAAKAAALRGAALSPDSQDAHAALGAARLYYDWDWLGAYAELSRALVLDPNSARAHTWMSRYQSASGRQDEAIAHAREADRLLPGSPRARTALGMALFYARRFTEAESTCESATALMKQFGPAWNCAMSAAAERGDQARVMTFWSGLAAAGGSPVAAFSEASNRTGYSMTEYWRETIRTRSPSTMPSRVAPASLTATKTLALFRELPIVSIFLLTLRHG